jgi:hypothetical protein
MTIDQLPFTGAVDNTNLPLRDKLALFGPSAIPLIVPYGSKGKPVPGSPWNNYMKEWSKRTHLDCTAPEYQHDLFCDTPKNIAIRQGGNLSSWCAFDFDTDDPPVWTEFFGANPKLLKDGLVSIGARGFTLWRLFKGPYPARKRVVWSRGQAPGPGEEKGAYEAVEWRGNGYSIIHGAHPKGFSYQLFSI